MKRYQIQALDGWNKLKLNETLEFTVKGTSRTIRVEFNTSDKVALYGSHTKDFADEKLLVSEEGLFTLITSISQTLYVRAASKEKSASITYKNRASDHNVEKMSDIKFTGLEMRRTRNPEMERLMHMVKTAQSEREQILLAEIAKVKTQNVEVIEDVKGAFPELAEGNKPSLPPSGLPKDNAEGTETVSTANVETPAVSEDAPISDGEPSK
ncbi:hypothetical protein N9895_02415 [Gammaproteobacteria bacterium]|nr:hypothetical protein [Gammaproteobacteria bacterium]